MEVSDARSPDARPPHQLERSPLFFSPFTLLSPHRSSTHAHLTLRMRFNLNLASLATGLSLLGVASAGTTVKRSVVVSIASLENSERKVLKECCSSRSPRPSTRCASLGRLNARASATLGPLGSSGLTKDCLTGRKLSLLALGLMDSSSGAR